MGDIAREYLANSLESSQGDADVNTPTDIFSIETDHSEGRQNNISGSSTYLMASDQSQISRDVDIWLRGPMENAGIQDSRMPLTQRSVSANIPSYHSNGMWYIMAIILPFFSINNYPHWRCNPNMIVNTAELLITHFGRVCERVRCNFRRLAQNQISRELLATAMDIILVVYAIGFLVLSLYQASVIG
ncbi:uncharacterized protein [Epargyreus clarus]|uniref:uncharacterized protein n=1 Tax=Epargyreus clarus TaxID=520877 RepID=UPI003C30DB61